MYYEDYLQSFSQDEYCPFCHITKEEILEETKHFFVIPNRAPYNSPDHILIIPKKHIILLKELKKAELKQLRELTETRNQKLQQQHKGTTMLIRDSLFNQEVGKSISHLHLHIIPDIDI